MGKASERRGSSTVLDMEQKRRPEDGLLGLWIEHVSGAIH